MSAIITVKTLNKFYRVGREKVKALIDINIEIQKGEICCILGTSGSGKSTLLNQLAGLEKPTSGSVYIGKTNISRLSEDQLAGFRQRHIGFVFQSYNLITSMTAAENVAMPLLFRGMAKGAREREAMLMLKKVELSNRARHKPSEMSGGQQQRVGIARAFVAKPKIIFADEPTGNLDSKTTAAVMKMLIEMAHTHGITFVLVTHDRELAQYADRVITIMDGLVTSDKMNESPAYLAFKDIVVDQPVETTVVSLDKPQKKTQGLALEVIQEEAKEITQQVTQERAQEAMQKLAQAVAQQAAQEEPEEVKMPSEAVWEATMTPIERVEIVEVQEGEKNIETENR